MADSGVQVVPFLTPHELVELAAQMRDLGVAQFSYAGVTIRFTKGAAITPMPRTIEKDNQPEPHDLRGPDMYKRAFGGKLPSFPGEK